MDRKLPEEDLKLINDSFKQTGRVETLGKNVSGHMVTAKKRVVNEKSFVFKNFSGRVLKHQKSIVILGTGQLIIGVKGQKYDDIPLDDRKLVTWDESDFEYMEGIK
jgi:hypothetical protein